MVDGDKKVAALVILGLVVLSLIPVTVRPLTYQDVDWVRLGYQVYSGPPTPGPPPVYLPFAMPR